MINWKEILLFAGFGFVITWLGTFLINLIRVPAIIHSEQVKENSKLRQQLKELLETPKRSPAEEHRYRMATEALSRLTDREKAFEVLRHIHTHESVTFDEFTPTLPRGLTENDFIQTCRECEREDLLEADRPRPGKAIYRITPGIRKALEQIIFAKE